VLELAALDAAYAFFNQAQALVERRDGSKFNFNRGSLIVEGSKNLGLHVAHLFDQLIAKSVHFASHLVAHLGDLATDLTNLATDLTNLATDLSNLGAHLIAQLIHVFFGGGAGIIGHVLSGAAEGSRT
jgi:hypothetical protein